MLEWTLTQLTVSILDVVPLCGWGKENRKNNYVISEMAVPTLPLPCCNVIGLRQSHVTLSSTTPTHFCSPIRMLITSFLHSLTVTFFFFSFFTRFCMSLVCRDSLPPPPSPRTQFFTLFFFLTTVLSQWYFSHGKFWLLSPGKANCDRVALPNLRCMLGVSVFPKSTEL